MILIKQHGNIFYLKDRNMLSEIAVVGKVEKLERCNYDVQIEGTNLVFKPNSDKAVYALYEVTGESFDGQSYVCRDVDSEHLRSLLNERALVFANAFEYVKEAITNKE